MAKPVLGRGLGALLGGVPPNAKPAPAVVSESGPATSAEEAGAGERVLRIPLDRVQPSSLQPRREFGEESLRELADSIREQGILQPLIVRQAGDRYELIAGERRWRAAQQLALTEVPVIVRAAADQQVLEMALIENLQRDNLNPLEEALGYSKLIEEFKLRQEDVADKVGRSRAAVANALRLLRLPEDVQHYVRDGRLSVGHAKVILGLADTEKQNLAAERILKSGLNVRQAEELVAGLQKPAGTTAAEPRRRGKVKEGDARVVDLESRLQERFATKVHLHYRQGKGYLQVRFFSDEELERILQIAGVTAD